MKKRTISAAAKREVRALKKKPDSEVDFSDIPLQDPNDPKIALKWANAVVGKHYRPIKTAVSLRIDNDVLDWLKSKGEGHLTRVNQILRDAMMSDLRGR